MFQISRVRSDAYLLLFLTRKYARFPRITIHRHQAKTYCKVSVAIEHALFAFFC